MAKGSSTNGWDAVTSYSITALNGVLAASYHAGSLAKELKFSVTRTDPISQKPFTVDYDVTLGAPALQFVGGQSGVATVNMPIAGGNATITPAGETGYTKALPTGYSVVANVPLAALTGDGQITTAGNVVTFAHPDDTAHIVLHFKSGQGSGTTFEIEPAPDPANEDVMVTYFVPLIQQYFAQQVNELDYALTGVTPKAAAGEIVIEPKTFVFASDTDVLSLYLMTTNSSGVSGNIHPSFQPGGVEMLPIPAGHTASVILAQELVRKIYVDPALAALGRVEDDESVPGGIRLRLYRDLPSLEYNASGGSYQKLAIDTLRVDFSQLPYQLKFVDNTFAVSWSFSQSLRWTTDDIDPSTHDDQTERGTTTVYASLPEQTVQLTASGDDVSLTFSIHTDDYHISADGPTGWFSDGDMVQGKLTSFLQGNAPVGFTFAFGSLNYFTAANLLFPNSHKFQVDATTGINIPCDLLILGQIG
ncbi:MAG: hypothetical protein KIT31_17275 [Deltaproteobacteria bacterium]|nr:hypothetical protein [Deltaproteobacteria bacterium]